MWSFSSATRTGTRGITRVPATARLAHIRLVRRTTGRLPPLQPDRFVDKQDAVHPSCFALKHGVLTLARETAWLKRLGLVEARLRYHHCPVLDAQHLVDEFLFYGDDSRACEAELADVPYVASACPDTAFSRAIKCTKTK
mmetsp:Transcript_22095/g.52391  ORF Transcript_22095/g.52391 Transcript_22095/m.52391 type:complete len:140 (-) Transcript_22095:24-443(-)